MELRSDTTAIEMKLDETPIRPTPKGTTHVVCDGETISIRLTFREVSLAESAMFKTIPDMLSSGAFGIHDTAVLLFYGTGGSGGRFKNIDAAGHFCLEEGHWATVALAIGELIISYYPIKASDEGDPT